MRVLLGTAISLLLATGAFADCPQSLLDLGHAAPSSKTIITPHARVQPFYEWYNNNGYCGETSLVQSGMSSGQWISQYNARKICGAGLSQTGPDNFCKLNDDNANLNAQILLESPLAGDSRYADGASCLTNFRLSFTQFDHAHQARALDGYKQYLSWIKTEIIAGHTVTIGVAHKGHDGPEYDHIVTATQIGTNHAATDTTYYDDDVLYFEDHGSRAVVDSKPNPHVHPAIPMAAQTAASGCNPFVFAYTFAELGNTRESANASTAPTYSILLPANVPVPNIAGGDGLDYKVDKVLAGNYGFSVAGPLDRDGVLKPITLTIIENRGPQGDLYPADPIAGFNYEAPFIGESESGASCTNAQPAAVTLTLKATISQLTAGRAYNLYEYDFDEIDGVGEAAKLNVPDANFNARAGLASHVTHFTATGSTFEQTVRTSSRRTILLRAVSAEAP